MDDQRRLLSFNKVALVVAGLVVSGLLPAGGQGARPIQFSEPPGGSTNALEVGAERSRLDALEDQISRSFDFLNQKESLRGTPAPLVRPPARQPVPPRTSKRKPGLFDDDDAWARSNPMPEEQNYRDLLATEPMTGVRGGQRPSAPSDTRSPSARFGEPDSLSDAFWELPLFSTTPSGGMNPRASEGFTLAAPSPPFSLERLFPSESSTPDVYGLGVPVGNGLRREFLPEPEMANREFRTARQEQYRSLLGPGSVPGSPSSPGARPSDRSVMSPWSPAPVNGTPWVAPETPRSLSPVPAPQLQRPLLPLGPVAPQRPSMRDLYEREAMEQAPSAAPARPSSPFQEPVRRGF